METALYYTLSTIAQTLAGALAILVAVVLFKLATLVFLQGMTAADVCLLRAAQPIVLPVLLEVLAAFGKTSYRGVCFCLRIFDFS